MKPISQFVTARECAVYFRVSERTVRRWRNPETGFLKFGLDYRKKFPGNPNSPMLYDLDRVEAKLDKYSIR